MVSDNCKFVRGRQLHLSIRGYYNFFVVLMVARKIIATFIVHHVHAIHYHDGSKNVTTVDCETINSKYGAAN